MKITINPQTIGTWIGNLLGPLLTAIGTPIGKFHLAVGHSTVSAAALLLIAAISSTWLYCALTAQRLSGVAEGREEYYRAIAARYVPSGGSQASLPQFTMATVRKVADGVEFKIAVVPSCKRVLVHWISEVGSGLKSFGSVDTSQTWFSNTITADTLGDVLTTSGNYIRFNFAQKLEDGTLVKHTGTAPSIRIPGPTVPIE
jgi:hypothetical protein